MVPIKREPLDSGPPFEDCCFCYKPTPYWTTLARRQPGQQVACCPDCAKTHEPPAVPTKEVWCAAAHARHPNWNWR